MFSVDPSDAGERRRRLPRSGRALIPVVAVAMIAMMLGGFALFGGGDDAAESPAVDEEAGVDAGPEGTIGESMPTRPEPTGDIDSGGTSDAVRTSCALEELIPRECLMFSPGDVAADERLPAVLILHGLSSTPQVASTEGGWRDLLADRRFHVVAPAGFGESWNAGPCCPPASALQLDDIAYLHQLLDDLEANPNVDASEIHIVGVSNGGILGYRFLCGSRGRVQSLVSFAGTRLTSCEPDSPVDILHVHGTSDEVVPYNNGLSLQAAVLGVDFPPVEPTMANLAADVGCGAPEDDAEVSQRVVARRWLNCDGGRRVELDIVNGAMHIQWMAGYDVARAMVDFMGL